jgi:hypothetical protein
MGGIGNAFYESADSDRLLALSAVVLVAEAITRGVLSLQFSSLLVVAWPPVVAALAFGLAHAQVGGKRFGRAPVTGPWQWTKLGLTLLLITVLGHLVALPLGGALFVVVDTPLRVVWYYLGIDLFRWPLVTLGLPVLGFALGTAIAWAIPAVLLASVSGGVSLRSAIWSVLGQRRLIDRVAFLNMLVVTGFVSAIVGATLIVGDPPRETQVDSIVSLWPFGVVLLSLIPICSVLPLAASAHAAKHGTTANDGPRNGGPASVSGYRGPAVRLAVALLLVLSLAAVAGFVRTEEVRPMESPETTFYDDSPQSMFKSAQLNMFQVSHEGRRYQIDTDGDSQHAQQWLYDRQRRYASHDTDSVRYSPDRRTAYGGHPVGESAIELFLRLDWSEDTRAIPNDYAPGGPHQVWLYAVPAYEIPGPGANSEVVTETEDKIVLRSTEIDADPLSANSLEEPDGYSPSQVQEYDDQWIEIQIDAETETLERVEYEYEAILDPATVSSDADRRHTMHIRWEVDTNRPFDYPEDVNSPSLEERLWDLLIY